mmetsp:Transcript_28264/g.62052  ORF Transcript_28264/g.62052 Transcript_28264/m.62052 type:complete len:310 (+) Transcript_28264:116-1045(+)
MSSVPKQAKEKTKVIVRKLPPGLTEEGFKGTVDKLIQGKYDWLAYYQGKVSTNKVVFSRAYINFTSGEAVRDFKQRFDGHTFVGSRGNQYRCSVEFAPFQKVPNLTQKKDARDGTIEKDPDYMEFVRVLEEGHGALPSASAQLEAREAAEKANAGSSEVVVTPLMEFLRHKYASNPGMKLGSGRGKGARGGKRAEESQATKSKDRKGGEDKGGRGRRGGVESDTKDAAAAAAAAAMAAAAAVLPGASSTAKGDKGQRGDSAKGGRGKKGQGQALEAAAEPEKVVMLLRPGSKQEGKQQQQQAPLQPACP